MNVALWAEIRHLSENGLLDSSGAGWQLEGAWSINSSGNIVGYGINPDGHQDGFLLTAVPEPGSFVLLCAGLASIGSFGWIKKRNTKPVAAQANVEGTNLSGWECLRTLRRMDTAH